MTTTMTTITTPACFFCGESSTKEITTAQARALEAGAPVQNVLPECPLPERELFISGIHPHCWEEMLGNDPE